jgi:hypothetical protein
MTLVELLTFLGVILCGALAGAGVGAVFGFLHGGVYGAVVTFLAFSGYAQWFRKMDSFHPPCRCGRSDWRDFELGRAEGITNVWQCACGKRYSWPKWRLWFEIDDLGTSRLFMRRDFMGRWRAAEK